MKSLCLTMICCLTIILSGCSSVQLTPEVKEGYFRFLNFTKRESHRVSFVYLMCFRQKPTGWRNPKEYRSGKHNLVVKAVIEQPGYGSKEAYANFNVDLDSGKRYMLNKKGDNAKISIWIQDVDTGVIVSDIVVSDLKNALVYEESIRKKQCKASSI